MSKKNSVLLAFFAYAIVSIGQDKVHPLGHEVIRTVFEQTKKIERISYTMKKQERFNGEMITQQTAVKVVNVPFQVYLKQEFPKVGLEVLYVNGKNNNNAIINTNGFPWVNLTMNPMGSVMRDKQHHTLLKSGYTHVISILEHLEKKYDAAFNSLIKNHGEVIFDGKPCWKIVLNNPHFKYYFYTIMESETILTIADRDKLSEYMILELNPKVSDYSSVKPGQRIKVPNDYSPLLELYIEKKRMIPLMMKVQDEKGLYELYEYYKVELNPIYQKDEFDKNFSEYNF